MGYPYPVDLFSNRELTRDSLSKTVVDFLRQGNVIRAVPDPRAVVEPEYLVDPIVRTARVARAGAREERSEEAHCDNGTPNLKREALPATVKAIP